MPSRGGPRITARIVAGRDVRHASSMQILQYCSRIYANGGDREATIGFYENLQGRACERRVSISETNIKAAKVGVLEPGERNLLHRRVGRISRVARGQRRANHPS